MRSVCNLCAWQSQLWPTRDQAGYEATWHVWEEHPAEWVQLFGGRPPADPDPRTTCTCPPHLDGIGRELWPNCLMHGMRT